MLHATFHIQTRYSTFKQLYKLNKETKEAIPLIISILLAIATIGIVLSTDYIIYLKHYIGIVALGIASLLYFRKRNLYFYFFSIILFAGVLNLIDFFYISFGIGIGKLILNPLFIALLFCFLFLNKEKINELFPEKEINPEKEKEKVEKRIKHFENKFSKLSELELKEIMNKNSPYVIEARKAAERILKNKNVL